MDVCSPQIIAIDLIVFLGSPLAQFGKDGGAKSDEFSERFQRHLTPTPTLRMVPISGYHVHAFHTIWPSYLLAHSRPYSLQKFYNNNFPKMRGEGSKAVWNFRKFIRFGSTILQNKTKKTET